MKTLLYSGIGLLLLGIAVVLVIPGLMDWNQYKGQIVNRVADELGREFVVSGDISLSVIPKTKFSLNGIYIGNIEGASNPRMAHLKSLDVEVSLIPLLMGSIEIRRLILVEPELILERLGDGRTNWGLLRENESGVIPFIEGISPDISFEEVFISKGSLEYIDSSKGTSRQIENVNLRFSAASLSGPFYLNGELTTAGMDVLAESVVIELDGQSDVRARGNLKTNGFVFRFLMESVAGKEGLSDWVGEVKVAGDEDFEGPYLGQPWMQVLLDSTRGEPDAIQLASKFSLGDGFLRLTEANFRLGEVKGTAIISLERDGFQGTIDLGHLNLDRIFGSQSSVSARDLSSLAGVEKLISGLTADPEFAASLGITAETVQYKGDAIRDILITTNIRDGAVDFVELSGLFPGGSTVQVDGGLKVEEGLPAFTGLVEGKSDNFQGLLNWLSVDTRALAGDRLRRLSFSAKLDGTAASGSFTDIDLQLDTSNIRGGIAYAISNGRLGLGVGIHLDQLNVDAYFPQQVESGDEGTGSVRAASKAGVHLPSIFSEFDADFDVKLDEVLLKGVPVTGVVLDGLWQQGVLDLREVGIRDLSGASLSFSGLVSGTFDDPTVQGSFSLSTAKVGSLARIIPELQQTPKFLLNSAEIDLAVRGNAEAVTVDGVIEAMGSQLSVRGTLQDVLLPGEIDIVSELDIPSVAKFVGLLSASSVNVPVNLLQVDIPLHLKFQIVGVPSSFNLEVAADLADGHFGVSGAITNFLHVPAFDLSGHFSHPSVGSFYEVLVTNPHSTLIGMDRSVEVEISLQGTDKKFNWESSLKLENLVVNGLGKFEGGYKDIKIRADHPDVGALSSIFGAQAMKELSAGPFSLSMPLQLEQEGLQIPELQLNIGSSDIRGRLNIDSFGERTKLVGNLESDSLDVDALPFLFLRGLDDSLVAVESDHPMAVEPVSGTNNSTSSEPIKSVWNGLESEIALKARKFHALGQTIHDADINLRLDAGVLSVDNLSGHWHAGDLKANGKMEFGLIPEFTISLELKDAELRQLFQKHAGVSPITGLVNIEADFFGKGRNINEIGTSLGGKGRMDSVDGGIIQGVNLRQFSDRLHNLEGPASLMDLVGIILDGGETTYSEYSGVFTADKGTIEVRDFSLFLDGAEANVSGMVDLAAGIPDLEIEFYLVDHPSLPPLQLYLTGDVKNPDVDLQTEELRAHILSAVAENIGVPADLKDIVEDVGDIVVGQQRSDEQTLVDEADNLIELLTAPELTKKEPAASGTPAEDLSEEDKFRTLLRDLLSD